MKNKSLRIIARFFKLKLDEIHTVVKDNELIKNLLILVAILITPFIIGFLFSLIPWVKTMCWIFQAGYFFNILMIGLLVITIPIMILLVVLIASIIIYYPILAIIRFITWLESNWKQATDEIEQEIKKENNRRVK